MPTQIFGGSHDGGVVTSDARIAVGPTADVPPLLERESELLAIGERLRALRDGVGSVLLIEGEAGIGKSSLLRQAATNAGAGSRVSRKVNWKSRDCAAPVG